MNTGANRHSLSKHTQNRNIMKALAAALFATFLFPLSLAAQFTGSVVVEAHKVNYNNEPVEKAGEFVVRFGRTGIRVEGLDDVGSIDELQGLEPSALIIRNDKKDFVLVAESDGKNEALVITKAEIENMMSMFAQFSTSEVNSGDATNIDRTNDTKTIAGLRARKTVVTRMEGNQLHVMNVWEAEKEPVDWGILAEEWTSLPQDLGSVLTSFMGSSKGLPLLIEVIENGNPKFKIEVVSVDKKQPRSSAFSVPEGTTIIGFQDLLWRKMMGN